MNKKLLKIVNVLVIAFMIVSIATNVFALNSPKELTGSTNVVNGTTEITNTGNAIISILRTVGIVLSVVVLIIIGIKYMMGSAEEKAEYKKTMIPYIVGAALIFAASIFADVIFKFFNGMNNQYQ